VSPHGNYWIYCHTHGRFERAKLLTVAIVDLGQGVHGGSLPLRREEDVGFGDGHRVQDRDRDGQMLDVLKGYFRVSRVVFDSWYWSEKLVKENVVSELKYNRAQGRVGPGDPRGGGGTPPSGRPPESTTPT